MYRDLSARDIAEAQLLAARDTMRDQAICGHSLARDKTSHFKANHVSEAKPHPCQPNTRKDAPPAAPQHTAGSAPFPAPQNADETGSRALARHAHEPTATPYFILETLFAKLDFDEGTHLLDVGCGAGRALAYFAQAHFPGRATGIELDPQLARFAATWTRDLPTVDVIEGSATAIPLDAYTHFYLFNPFDSVVLVAFLDAIEAQVAHPIALVHMSDNGENYSYLGRAGWTLADQGEFQEHPGSDGAPFALYAAPQHYSIWRYDPQ